MLGDAGKDLPRPNKAVQVQCCIGRIVKRILEDFSSQSLVLCEVQWWTIHLSDNFITLCLLLSFSGASLLILLPI